MYMAQRYKADSRQIFANTIKFVSVSVRSVSVRVIGATSDAIFEWKGKAYANFHSAVLTECVCRALCAVGSFPASN